VEHAAVPEFLQDKGLGLLLFGGKGGVGKTTCASAAALYLAAQRPQSSFLLVSTDPAHSLKDCLGGEPLPANLELCEIDPQQSLQRFKDRHQEHLRLIALRGTFLDQADVTQLVDLSIPGLDEMMALLEIETWVKQARHACIVVDTAPAGHTLRLLGLPAMMRKWIAALDAMLAKHRYMTQLYLGSYEKDAADLYLEETRADLKRLWSLLRSPKRCRFVPVMLAEALSIHVTRLMLVELERLGLPLREIIVNRRSGAQVDCPLCSDGATRQALTISELTQAFSKYSFWSLPRVPGEARGPGQLLTLWQQALPLVPDPEHALQSTPGSSRLGGRRAGRLPLVSHPARLPAASTRLLMFAGKGGVGKTTLACASALRLAQERAGQEVLLFSIDPAHSLAACLGREVGAKETRVAPGLSVIELDAQAEYLHLKKNFAAELTGAFGRNTSQAGMELAFDRDVMERLLDVAPAGLDEMLALTRIVDLMDRNCYDLFVLDTAPTGHLLRFLEMPELIEKWLKTFFGLFLKYRDVFWLPRIARTMVDLSRKMKSFRRLLSDAGQAALVAVSIPTEMAFAETQRLISACERLGMAVPILFLNLLTPASVCPVCSRRARTELPLLQRYQLAHAGHHLGLVFRQQEPRGIDRLSELGRSLYQAAGAS
jgi:arsenite-transporting ATPase